MNIILKEIFIFSLSMCAILIFLTGCNNDNELNIEDKTNAEIEYLENCVFTITNKYVKGEYNSLEGIKWNEVKDDAMYINNTVDTILVDFSEYDISNEELLNFRNNVNNLNIVIKNENEGELLITISKLYKLLPVFLENYSQDINKINIYKLKSFALESIAYANILDWENSKLIIEMAESKYTEMINDANFIKYYSYDINKIYVLLEEMKNVIEMEELELTKIKYINFVEKI